MGGDEALCGVSPASTGPFDSIIFSLSIFPPGSPSRRWPGHPHLGPLMPVAALQHVRHRLDFASDLTLWCFVPTPSMPYTPASNALDFVVTLAVPLARAGAVPVIGSALLCSSRCASISAHPTGPTPSLSATPASPRGATSSGNVGESPGTDRTHPASCRSLS